MGLAPVELAKKLLTLPEGPSHAELRLQARVYLADLTKEEYNDLLNEALQDKSLKDEEKEYLDKVSILKRLQFTEKEVQAYAKMRLDSPGVRRVVARRALLIMMLRQPLPSGATFYEVARMEDAFLKGLSDEEVYRRLGVRRDNGRR